jgi:hypothetical protein
MPLIRSLLFEAARRAASNPEVRNKAVEITRDHVAPAARQAARRAGETVRRERDALRHDVDAARSELPADAPRAELAGRIARRMLDRARGPKS